MNNNITFGGNPLTLVGKGIEAGTKAPNLVKTIPKRPLDLNLEAFFTHPYQTLNCFFIDNF